MNIGRCNLAKGAKLESSAQDGEAWKDPAFAPLPNYIN